MNIISQLRKLVALKGWAVISVDDFNQLQAEWITRVGMEPEPAQPVQSDVGSDVMSDKAAYALATESRQAILKGKLVPLIEFERLCCYIIRRHESAADE
jgi:hypothetical protein